MSVFGPTSSTRGGGVFGALGEDTPVEIPAPPPPPPPAPWSIGVGALVGLLALGGVAIYLAKGHRFAKNPRRRRRARRASSR